MIKAAVIGSIKSIVHPQIEAKKSQRSSIWLLLGKRCQLGFHRKIVLYIFSDLPEVDGRFNDYYVSR